MLTLFFKVVRRLFFLSIWNLNPKEPHMSFALCEILFINSSPTKIRSSITTTLRLDLPRGPSASCCNSNKDNDDVRKELRSCCGVSPCIHLHCVSLLCNRFCHGPGVQYYSIHSFHAHVRTCMSPNTWSACTLRSRIKCCSRRSRQVW